MPIVVRRVHTRCGRSDREHGIGHIAAIRTEERYEKHAEHVIRGDACGQRACEKQHRMAVFERAVNDRVFGIKSREERKADNRKRAREHRGKRKGHLPIEAPHLAHVLLVMQRVDDEARAQKELRFKERVREEMQHARLIRSDADAHDHIADLRHRRIGEDAFDIPLGHAENRTRHHGDRADHGDHFLRGRREIPQRREARDEIHARGDHRCGMDERGDRSRTFHRIGEPRMQRDLRRFRHRTDEEPDTDREHERFAKRSGFCEDIGKRNRSRRRIAREDREHDADIAEDVDDERFARRSDGRRFVEPEADQKIRCEANETPAHE